MNVGQPEFDLLDSVRLTFENIECGPTWIWPVYKLGRKCKFYLEFLGLNLPSMAIFNPTRSPTQLEFDSVARFRLKYLARLRNGSGLVEPIVVLRSSNPTWTDPNWLVALWPTNPTCNQLVNWTFVVIHDFWFEFLLKKTWPDWKNGSDLGWAYIFYRHCLTWQATGPRVPLDILLIGFNYANPNKKLRSLSVWRVGLGIGFLKLYRLWTVVMESLSPY